MTLTFDNGETVIEIEAEKKVEYKTLKTMIRFSRGAGSANIFLTRQELEIFILALRVITRDR